MTAKKILTYIGWFFAVYLVLSIISSIIVCIGKNRYSCDLAARSLGEKYGGLMLLVSVGLTITGIKKNLFPKIKIPMPTSEHLVSVPKEEETDSVKPHSASTSQSSLSGLKDKINYKAVLLGIGGGFLGGIVGGFLISTFLTLKGEYSSVEMIGFYLQENILLLYALNIFGGLVLGFVVSRIAKRHLSENLLIASTAFIGLSIITNTDLMRNFSWGIYSYNELLYQALLPLLAAWASPFIFLFNVDRKENGL